MTDTNDNPIISNLISEEEAENSSIGRPLNAVFNVPMTVNIVIGRAEMPISQLLSMSRGSVIELDKKIGQPVEAVVGNRTIARGELVKVGENGMGLKLTEIIKDFVPKERN